MHERRDMGGVSFAPIPGTDGRYVADSEGNVYGPRGLMKPQHRASRSRRCKPGWAHQSVTVQTTDGERSRAVHRLVFAAFHGQPAAGIVVRHVDGDPTSNRLVNLASGTPAENVADSIRHGTFARGERHGQARLTDSQVSDIRRRYAAGGVSYRSLASEYGVSHSNIRLIVRGHSRREAA